MKMRPFVAVVALINGMIGSLILVLPILALTSGTAASSLIILISGFFSFYSCYLYIKHLGNHSDIDKALYYHFGSSKIMQVLYNFIIFLNLLLILISYFLLIVQQWSGLVSDNIGNPIGNAIFLIGLILFLKYIRFGAHLLGYGVISIALYCVFLVWLLVTKPQGPKTMPIFGQNITGLAAAIGQGFSIQQFFVPVLKQLPVNQSKYFIKYTFIVYLIGGSIYFYIALAGSYGILNRNLYDPQTTIQSYFNKSQWQVKVLQIVYLLHLYSAFGQFFLISKKRLFCVFATLFKTKNTKEGQFFTYQQVVYLFFAIGLCLGLNLGHVQTDKVIEINGSVVGFFFIYLIPAMLQFKCIYLPRPKPIIQVVFSRNFKTQSSESKRIYQLKQRAISRGFQSILNQSINKQKLLPPQNKQENNITDLQNKQKLQHIGYTEKHSERKQSEQIPLQKLIQKQSPIQNHLLSDPNKEDKADQMRKRNSSRISAFELQGIKINNRTTNDNQYLIAGADVSIAISKLGEQESSMTVQKLNEMCPCQKPQGIYKILDILSIIGMIGFGLFIMVHQIINMAHSKKE